MSYGALPQNKFQQLLNSTSQKTNIKDYGVDWEASGCRSFIISHLHVILGILVFLENPNSLIARFLELYDTAICLLAVFELLD